ncbi:MAG: ABC transporter ATP-binding protein/permease [Clostridia bacterium]|nr:ABC transporter ATP-binding protein/permease [Clostridia bacterium]
MINKRLLSLVPNIAGSISKIVFFQWLCLVCNMVSTITICLFINQCYIKKSADLKTIFTMVIIILISIILRACFNKRHIKTAALLSQKAKSILRQDLFSHLSEIGQSYNQLVSTAEAVQVSVEGIDQLESYFGAYLPQLFYAVIAPVTLFVVISFLNIQAAVILLICVPLIPLSIIAVQKLAKKLLSKYWNEYTELGDSFLENIQGLTTLKIYEADEYKHKEMNIKAENFRKATMRVLIMQLNSISVMDIVAYGGAAAGIIAMLLCMNNGKAAFLEGIIIILLSAEFFIPMRQLGSFFHIAMNGTAAADKIFKILDTKAPEKGNLNTFPDYNIFMDNITFSYDQNQNVLRHISLKTENQGLYSLVGKSGCGKSTTAALLTGKLKNYKGNIFIGNKELSRYSEKALMNTITLINHNSYIFKGTIESNLKMGNKNAEKKELLNALKTVNLEEFPLNYAIAEQGSNLSGGQKQRLALARALLHDTPIYIFDEATSNIDVESENIIIKTVIELSKNKLVFLISHRLANVIGSDKIFVFENGFIAEEGKHNELLELKGIYSDLFNKQMYIENFVKGGTENEK